MMFSCWLQDPPGSRAAFEGATTFPACLVIMECWGGTLRSRFRQARPRTTHIDVALRLPHGAALRCPVSSTKCDVLRRSHKFCEVHVQALPDRWVIAIGGSVVMLLIGTVYSWAIFAQPLVVGFGWDLTTTTWAYAIANFSLATVGVVVGGFWLDRKGPRPVAMTGVALWGAGNVLAGLGTPLFGAPWLYMTYGLIGGMGAGMAYITPLAVVSKWFPERRGLAGGLVVGSFGLGAFVYNEALSRLPSFLALSPHTVTQFFVASGAIFLAIGLPAASL